MRYNKKGIIRDTQQNVVEYCRCPHDSSLHGPKGCTGEIVRFGCERRGHDPRIHDTAGTACIFKIPCRCRFSGKAKMEENIPVLVSPESQ